MPAATAPGSGSWDGSTAAVHGLTGVADAGAFLARLVRLDAGALVRLRAVPDGAATAFRTALWARLPWGVLVTRDVAGPGPAGDGFAGDGPAGYRPADVTVSAAQLLAELAKNSAALPPRHDAQWRWPLPPPGARALEAVDTAELAQLAAAAAGTLRDAAATGLRGRSVGERAVRDALLDHVALVVTPGIAEPIEVPQRLVQAVSRMGFLGSTGVDGAHAMVCRAGRWLGISAPYGVGWLPPVKTLTVMTISISPNG